MAEKCRLELVDHPLAELCAFGGPYLLQKWKQQPAADPPRHSERPVQLDRTRVEAAIDIDLLVHARSVAAVDFCGFVDRNLHASEDLTSKFAATDGIERQRRTGFDQRARQIFHEGRRGGIDDVFRPDLAQDIDLLRAAHDIDETDAVLEADLVEHLPKVGRGCRMDERLMCVAPPGLAPP